MASSSTPKGDPRIVPFRRQRGGVSTPHHGPDRPPDDLASYAKAPEDPGDYRHRMAVNAAALLFVVGLIGAALWLADSISAMRRNQDCVLSGRRGCTPVEYDHNLR